MNRWLMIPVFFIGQWFGNKVIDSFTILVG